MNNKNKAFSYKKFLIQLATFTVVLYAIQTYVIFRSFPNTEFYFKTWEIYGFQFITVSILIYFLNRINNSKPKSILSAYLILTLLKMGAALLFLLPLFLDSTILAKPAVFSFFIAFFLFLFLETKFVLKILTSKK